MRRHPKQKTMERRGAAAKYKKWRGWPEKPTRKQLAALVKMQSRYQQAMRELDEARAASGPNRGAADS